MMFPRPSAKHSDLFATRAYFRQILCSTGAEALEKASCAYHPKNLDKLAILNGRLGVLMSRRRLFLWASGQSEGLFC